MADCLEQAGCRVTLVGDTPDAVSAGSLVWAQGNAAWFPAVWRRLRGMPEAERPPSLVWQSEPLPPPRASGLPFPRPSLREIAKVLLRDPRATDVYTNWIGLARLNRAGLPDVIVVSAPGRQQFLAERGIPAHFVPIGSSPAHGSDLGLARDIDVLFLGDLNVPRRRRVLRMLEHHGIDCLAVGGWADPAYWGDARTRLLNRVKVMVNIPRTPGEYSGIRLLLALANKVLVVSEPIVDPSPYVPGRHFVMAPLAEMPAVIRHYLADEPARQAIVEEGHRMITTELTMAKSVERILAHVAAHEAARGTATCPSPC